MCFGVDVFCSSPPPRFAGDSPLILAGDFNFRPAQRAFLHGFWVGPQNPTRSQELTKRTSQKGWGRWLGGGFKYFLFSPLLGPGNDPNWLIFFRWVETTTYVDDVSWFFPMGFGCCWLVLGDAATPHEDYDRIAATWTLLLEVPCRECKMVGGSFSKSALHLRPTEKVELFTSFCIAHETRLDIDLWNISFCMGLASQLSSISIDKMNPMCVLRCRHINQPIFTKINWSRFRFSPKKHIRKHMFILICLNRIGSTTN